METAIVLVECTYPENLGLAARAMKNFGLKKLFLVNPLADKESDKAKSRAMHAQDLLKNASIHSSLESALAKTDFSIATTAFSSQSKGKGRKALTPKQLAEKFSDSNAKIALVFGREPNGLTNEEIQKCDFIVSIPTNKKYPVLNLSHACSILFYELFQSTGKRKKLFKTAGKKHKQAAIQKFRELAQANPRIRNKQRVTNSFKHLISRAPVTEKELKAITGVIAESLKKIKKDCQ